MRHGEDKGEAGVAHASDVRGAAMSAKVAIRCSCGRRISAREVLRHGIFMHHYRPLYAYVRYRCARCKRLGEKLIDYELWDQSVLHQPSEELTEEEQARFDQMGEIEPDEVIQFVAGVRRLTRRGLAGLRSR
jgi:hypothetical protein